MAETQPPADPHPSAPPVYTLPPPPTTTPQPEPPLPTAPSKRQRRPSVRLGEIGDQNPNPRYTKFNKFSSKSSKTRPIMNLSSNNDLGIDYNLENVITDGGFHDFDDIGVKFGGKMGKNVGTGSWKVKDSKNPKRNFEGFSSFSNKRVRSNWVVTSKSGENDGFEVVGEEEEDGFDDVERYSDQSDREIGNGFGGGVRVSDGPSGDDSGLERNGVRVWLNQLGLGRYYSVFEVHEVDDEVLPLLTLEDLKDMGINAVGSRRKMFCSIQKLGKGFS